jgi:hypothetical protein
MFENIILKQSKYFEKYFYDKFLKQKVFVCIKKIQKNCFLPPNFDEIQ